MYRLEVQLTPQIHEGSMKHYWHIFLLDGTNKITVAHGWSDLVWDAHIDAHEKAYELGLSKVV